jgi:hypothetical protein
MDLLNIVGVMAVVGLLVVGFGKWRWVVGTRRLHRRLDGGRAPIAVKRFDARELDGLPAPARRFFRAVLTDGQPMVAAVRVVHVGTFNLGSATPRWKPFTSTQRVVTCRPGFDWDARVAMVPGLAVHVHDAYVAGEGHLEARVLGLITVASLHGPGAVAEGELMRFLAEAAWYPTVLLPSQGVRWAAVDASSALATISDGGNTVTLRFDFQADGTIETVRAEARGRTIGNRIVPTPWRGRFWDYTMRDGMRVPLAAEVAWMLPEGPQPYWRGRIIRIGYAFA